MRRWIYPEAYSGMVFNLHRVREGSTRDDVVILAADIFDCTELTEVGCHARHFLDESGTNCRLRR